MYTHYTEPFGSFERHTLESKTSGNRMVIVPGKGGCLLDLSFAGTPVIDGFESPEKLDSNSGAKSMPLFPFPGRLREGTYAWRGKTYQFPKTDKAGPNAIHGIGRHVQMAVSRQVAEETQAEFSCFYEHDGSHIGYPFPFRFSMNYRIDDSSRFSLEMAFTNHHNAPIPVGFGWHPYFTLGKKADEMSLQLPPCDRIEFDEFMIPTGKRVPFEDFRQLRQVGDFRVDGCFALTDPDAPAEVLLQGEKGRLRYSQETGPEKFNYFVVYIPEERMSIAVEPMTCNANAFNNGDGLIVLEPEETAKAVCRLEWI